MTPSHRICRAWCLSCSQQIPLAGRGSEIVQEVWVLVGADDILWNASHAITGPSTPGRTWTFLSGFRSPRSAWTLPKKNEDDYWNLVSVCWWSNLTERWPNYRPFGSFWILLAENWWDGHHWFCSLAPGRTWMETWWNHGRHLRNMVHNLAKRCKQFHA